MQISLRLVSEEMMAVDLECDSGGNVRIRDCAEGDADWERCSQLLKDMDHGETNKHLMRIHRIRHVSIPLSPEWVIVVAVYSV